MPHVSRHKAVAAFVVKVGRRYQSPPVCSCGGIGRRAGFRFQWETVQVQVLSAAWKHPDYKARMFSCKGGKPEAVMQACLYIMALVTQCPGMRRQEEKQMGLSFFLNSILLGAGLAMDAFSVSCANGLREPNMKAGRMVKIAGVYAFFQFAMPMAGWFCVHQLLTFFRAFQPFIPWIALGLLGWILRFADAGSRDLY